LKKLTIVNRHYPPNINITGENAWDLANYLIGSHGIDVAVVHIDRSYEGGGNRRQPVGKVFPVSTVYEGNNKILRYISGILDGWKLIRKAAELNHGPVIVMTSPPLLPMWASRILHRRKINWILWSMDLFPEGFAASDEVSENNFLYKYALRQTYKNAPSRLIALGPQQKQAIERKYGKEIEGVILPCGVFVDQNKTAETPAWKKEPAKIYLGYCGNCGNAHSADFITTVIDNIDPSKQHFILAVYGIKAAAVKKHAADKPGITIMESVPRNELQHIDIHLVTLVNSWTHVAVPSKAVSSVCSGASILFCGNKASDNWHLLSDAGWLIEDDHKMAENVRKLLPVLTREDIQAKKHHALRISDELSRLVRRSYDTIAGWATGN
jgi:hypothetical protein